MAGAAQSYKLKKQINYPKLCVFITLMMTLLSCNSRYKPIVVKEAGTGILVIDKLQFENVTAENKVALDECDLPKKLITFIDQFADKHYAQVLVNINTGSLPADTHLLKISIVDQAYHSGLAWSGNQSISLTGSLLKNELEIGNFKIRRYSKQSLFAGRKSTCSAIGRKLAKDIALWL